MKTRKFLVEILAWVAGLLLVASLAGAQSYGRPPVLGAVRASYYGRALEGHRMADGRTFHAADLTCASLHFPLGTFVEVQNIASGQTIVIEVTDRGPLSKLFGVDLSEGAYKAIGLDVRDGWGWVTIKRVNEHYQARHDSRIQPHL